MINSGKLNLLNENDNKKLAEVLSVDPCNNLAVYCLQHNKARAYTLGEPINPDAAIVEINYYPKEPSGYAKDVYALDSLLSDVNGWQCVLLEEDMAQSLFSRYCDKGRTSTKLYKSKNYLLNTTCNVYNDDRVRLLNIYDSALIRNIELSIEPRGSQDINECLDLDYIAAAILNEKIVSFCQLDGLTESYADCYLETIPECRNQGLAKACASLIVSKIQQLGRTPIWDTGHDNWASIAIAKKLGFSPLKDRAYLILDEKIK
jgi:hypothetical protein